METPHLIYFADPMCSWCYAFSPVIDDIRRAFGRHLPIQLVMGGLRPGTDTQMATKAKSDLVGHWHHITEATGLPFDGAVLDDPEFRYDTDPAARAVVWVRRHDPDRALTFLAELQSGFYAQVRDITRLMTLADMVAQAGFNRDAFLADFETGDLKNETWSDYATSQRAGVTGFPTLVAGPRENGTYGVVTRGYQNGDVVLPLLHNWVGS